MNRTPFDHDRDVLIDADEHRREEYRALAKIRLTMARLHRAAGDGDGARAALGAARFWRRAERDESVLILGEPRLMPDPRYPASGEQR